MQAPRDAPADAVRMTVCRLQPLAPASLTPRTRTSNALSASRFFFTHCVPLMTALAAIQPYSAPAPTVERRHCGVRGMQGWGMETAGNPVALEYSTHMCAPLLQVTLRPRCARATVRANPNERAQRPHIARPTCSSKPSAGPSRSVTMPAFHSKVREEAVLDTNRGAPGRPCTQADTSGPTQLIPGRPWSHLDEAPATQ